MLPPVVVSVLKQLARVRRVVLESRTVQSGIAIVIDDMHVDERRREQDAEDGEPATLYRARQARLPIVAKHTTIHHVGRRVLERGSDHVRVAAVECVLPLGLRRAVGFVGSESLRREAETYR